MNGEREADSTRITAVPAIAAGGRVKVSAENYQVQEGARRFTLTGGTATVALRNFEAVDIGRETNGDVLLLVTLKVWDARESAQIGAISPGSRGFSAMALQEESDWVRYGIPLKCLRAKGANVKELTEPFVLTTRGAADFAIGEVRLGTDAEAVVPCT